MPNVFTCEQCGKERRMPPSARMRFCSRQCQAAWNSAHRSGLASARFAGGRNLSPQGYVRIHAPDHPRASNGYVFEHILVVEAAIGHLLPLTAEVHHRDEQKAHNGPTNLIACENAAYHRLIHLRTRLYRDRQLGSKACSACKARKPFNEFQKNRATADGLSWECRACIAERWSRC